MTDFHILHKSTCYFKYFRTNKPQRALFIENTKQPNVNERDSEVNTDKWKEVMI